MRLPYVHTPDRSPVPRNARLGAGIFVSVVYGRDAIRWARRSGHRRAWRTRACSSMRAKSSSYAARAAGPWTRGVSRREGAGARGDRLRCRGPCMAGGSSESGGIGRRPGFRYQCRKAWGFESPLSHQPEDAPPDDGGPWPVSWRLRDCRRGAGIEAGCDVSTVEAALLKPAHPRRWRSGPESAKLFRSVARPTGMGGRQSSEPIPNSQMSCGTVRKRRSGYASFGRIAG